MHDRPDRTPPRLPAGRPQAPEGGRAARVPKSGPGGVAPLGCPSRVTPRQDTSVQRASPRTSHSRFVVCARAEARSSPTFTKRGGPPAPGPARGAPRVGSDGDEDAEATPSPPPASRSTPLPTTRPEGRHAPMRGTRRMRPTPCGLVGPGASRPGGPRPRDRPEGRSARLRSPRTLRTTRRSKPARRRTALAVASGTSARTSEEDRTRRAPRQPCLLHRASEEAKRPSARHGLLGSGAADAARGNARAHADPPARRAASPPRWRRRGPRRVPRVETPTTATGSPQRGVYATTCEWVVVSTKRPPQS